MIQQTITETDHCRRADSLLHNLLPDAPLSYRKKLISSGHLLVNGTPATPGTLLRLNDTITLKESSRTRALVAKRPPSLDILYEDGWILVFNKEPGLPMHPAAEVDGDNLVDVATEFYASRGGEAKLRPVNRLDRGTSGAVILAKSSSAAGMFGRFVKEEGLDKLYLALVEGDMKPEGIISAPLKGKEAETRYRLLFQGDHRALVALYPVSGRMHQIRQHMRLIGHPILGDTRYGGEQIPDQEGHALHSFKTAFVHPAGDERIIISAPLPEGFRRLIKDLAGVYAVAVLNSLAELPPVWPDAG